VSRGGTARFGELTFLLSTFADPQGHHTTNLPSTIIRTSLHTSVLRHCSTSLSPSLSYSPALSLFAEKQGRHRTHRHWLSAARGACLYLYCILNLLQSREKLLSARHRFEIALRKVRRARSFRVGLRWSSRLIVSTLYTARGAPVPSFHLYPFAFSRLYASARLQTTLKPRCTLLKQPSSALRRCRSNGDLKDGGFALLEVRHGSIGESKRFRLASRMGRGRAVVVELRGGGVDHLGRGPHL
jgi:hypothetical protein